VAALSGASLVLVGGAVTMAASPAPSASPDTTTGTEQSDEIRPFRDGRLGLGEGVAGFAGRHGGFGAGNITITAIDGSSVTLETVDGWTRTIEVASDTEITKDGDEAALSDLEVGDRIRFRQTRTDDTFEITDLVVVQPAVVGTVTAIDGDTITLRQPDGSSVAVTVDGSTEFTVGGEEDQSLADIEVGMVLGAAGELDDDGSLDASTVRAGDPGAFGRGGHHRHGPGMGMPNGQAPATDDEPSTSAS
jgi:hypothetical protein